MPIMMAMTSMTMSSSNRVNPAVRLRLGMTLMTGKLREGNLLETDKGEPLPPICDTFRINLEPSRTISS
jgi:hypothetical protein